MKTVLFIVLFLAVTSPAIAQAGSQVNRLHVSTRLVVLDAVVAGKDGKPVTGLSPSDFGVQEDDVPQTIQSVDNITLHAQAASTPQTVFVFDCLNSSLDESAYGRAQLLHYLQTQPVTLAGPAMLVAVNDHGFTMLQPYTRDRSRLEAAARGYQLGVPFDFTQHEYTERLTITFDALRQIALANSGTPRRTELVWLGHGFPGVTLSNLPPDTAGTLRKAVEDITNLLLDARIVLYKVDPAPVGSPVYDRNPSAFEDAFDEAPEPYADSISFDGVVLQTGGHSFFNRNDVHTELAEAVDLGSSFYTITYKPSGDGDAPAAYRHIRVSVRRPGLRVVTRLGYFVRAKAEPDQPPPSTPQALLDAAIINNLPYTGLHARVEGFSEAVAGVTHCTVRLSPESADWKTDPGGNRTMELLAGVAVYDARGKFLAYLRDAVTLHGRADDTPDSASLLFTLNLKLTAAAASLRVVVLDQRSGRLGSVLVAKVPAGALGR